MKPEEIKKIVKSGYEKIAVTPLKTCSCKNIKLAQSIGYSKEDIENVPEANLGLGCGNPLSFVKLKEGNVVLDLGSGAGFDAFLASKRVGNTGKVIGVDMTPEMVNKAKENALKYNYENVEFLLGDIENLPIENNSIDIVISNCVINLAPNKNKVFEECYRVLKENGKIYVSDIVLLENLSQEQKQNKKLISGCVAGALLREEYIKIIENAGFIVNILNEDKQISKEQYKGVNLESLKIEAIKKMITKKTKISKVLQKNEDAPQILFEAGMACFGCAMAQNETLEDGCKAHGMNNQEINELIKRLNN